MQLIHHLELLILPLHIGLQPISFNLLLERLLQILLVVVLDQSGPTLQLAQLFDAVMKTEIPAVG